MADIKLGSKGSKMSKSRVISFIFGSTALATSMSFVPLADAYADRPDIEDLMVSQIGTGQDHHFNRHTKTEIVDFDGVQVETKVTTGYSPKVARKNVDQKVGIFTTADACDAIRYAQAVYSFDNPDANEDIQKFKNEGSTVNFVKKLTADKDLTWGQTTFENQDTAMFVTKTDGTAVLSFKGSDRLNTWLSDFYAPMHTHANGGKYHGGFLTMYNELEASTWNHIMKFASSNGYSIEDALSKIRITGHSRGAGVAQVFADIARRKFGVAMETITFSAPRALHNKTAAEFNKAAKNVTLNIRQKNDPVAYAAFASLNGGAHVGNKVDISTDKASFAHIAGGIRKTLNTMHALGKVSRDESGNVYKFKAVEDGRDLESEGDYSAQAYAEATVEAVKNPVAAAQHVKETLEYAKENPLETAQSVAKRGVAIVKGAGTVIENTFKLGKMAAVGTVKAAEYVIDHPEEVVEAVTSIASEIGNKIVSTTKSAAESIASSASSAWGTVKGWFS